MPLIAEGMDIIAGQIQDSALEVGIDTDLTPTESAVSAIIARPRATIDAKKLSQDADGRLLLDGTPLECGYATFSLRRALTKADFFEIPELKDRYAVMQAAIRANKEKDAPDALTAFRLAAIASPDLIPSDVQALIEKAKQKVTAAFPPRGSAAIGKSVLREETLAEIGLSE